MQHPPAKRRKLSNHMQHSRWAEFREEVEDQPQALALARDGKPRKEAQLAQNVVRGLEDRQILLPRQDGTVPSGVTIATMSSSSISSISMASEATTSAVTTSVAGASETSTSDGTATTSNAGLALSVLLSAANSLPLSDIASAATGVPVSVVTQLLSDVSNLLVTSATETSSASSSLPGNDTASTSSATSISGGNITSSSLLPTSSSTGFSTSSFPRNSTTTASRTTSLSRTDSSSTESAQAFIATLSQGDETTLSRSASAYTTALDGSTLIVSAAETSIPTQFSRTADSSGSSSVTPFATTGDGDLTTIAAPISTESTSVSDTSSGSTPPAGTIAGGVVGGAAGLALVALIAMLAVRWYRRQGVARHQALPQGTGNSLDPNAFSSSGPGMAERAGLAPFVAAVPTLFRTQNRATGSEETAQRSFTRVAGRKLPSTFSRGPGSQLSTDIPVSREVDADLNETSFYRDSSGFHGGSGSPSSPTRSSPLRSDSYEHMTISRGPQRIPRLHSGGPYDMSPAGSAGRFSSPPLSGLTRSDAPFLLDPNRNSRFSEGL